MSSRDGGSLSGDDPEKEIGAIMLRTIKRLWTEEEAVSAVEYGIIASISAVAIVGALVYFRDKLRDFFKTAGDKVEAGE